MNTSNSLIFPAEPEKLIAGMRRYVSACENRSFVGVKLKVAQVFLPAMQQTGMSALLQASFREELSFLSLCRSLSRFLKGHRWASVVKFSPALIAFTALLFSSSSLSQEPAAAAKPQTPAPASKPQETNMDVRITSIKYGSKLENLVPVTEAVVSRINSGAKIKVSPKLAANDPAPIDVKYLYIEMTADEIKLALTFKDGETVNWPKIYKKAVEVAKQQKASMPPSDPDAGKPLFTKDKDAKTPFNAEAFRTSVDTAVSKLYEDIENPKLGGTELLCTSKGFRIIASTPEVEKTMGISREWYLSISKMLSEMAQYRMEYEIAEQRSLTERQLAAQKALIELDKKLKHLLEHPVKVKKKGEK